MIGILIIAHAERGSGEVVDDGGDLIIGDGVTIGGTGSAGIDAVREELQRADAVEAECGQQAVGVRATRADAFGNALADRVAVRKQVVEDIDDGRTDIAVFAQRQGEWDGESVLPCKPVAGVLEGDSAGGFAAQDPDKAAVQKDIEGRMRAAARH